MEDGWGFGISPVHDRPVKLEDEIGARVRPVRHCIGFDDVITVTVSRHENAKQFKVHTSVLTKQTPFFRKALSGNWKEAEEQIVKLPEDDPDTFAAYLHYLYSEEFAVDNDTSDDIDVKIQGMYIALAKIYVLAEKFQDTQAKNMILQTIAAECGRSYDDDHRARLMGPGAICLIYNWTPSESLARKLLVHLYAYFGDLNPRIDDDGLFSNCPRQFLQDLVRFLLQNRGWESLLIDPRSSQSILTYMEKIPEEDQE